MRREDSEWWSAGFTKEWWLALNPDDRRAFLDELTDDEADRFAKDWRVWARDKQLAPEKMPNGADWRTWLLVCGRGFGKTRTAVEFIHDEVEAGRATRIAIVGQGEDDIRTVMIEGQSGFLETARSWNRPKYSPSVGGGQLTWPNGAVGFIYSAEDPESLRGPQFDLAWFDEPMAVPAVKRQKTVMNLRMGLRLGKNPRIVYSTTPKPHQWLREMMAQAGQPAKRLLLTQGSTYENAENLADSFIEGIREDYEGTRLGDQELHGKLLGLEEGALWDTDMLNRQRILCEETDDGEWPTQLLVSFCNSCDKVVVAVDPNMRTNGTAHAAGIVVVAIKDGKFYVICDRSTKGGPSKWSQAAVNAALDFGANEIVAESNQGGEMVRMVIQQVLNERELSVPIHLTFASKGKQRRAEPVATRYERGQVFHLGPAGTSDKPAPLYKLEAQMTNIHDGDDPTGEDFDRADALVWGLTRLARRKSSASYSPAAGGFQTLEELSTNGQDKIDQPDLWERAARFVSDPV